MLLSVYCNLWKDYIFGTSRPKLGPRNLYFYNFLQICKTELRLNNFDLKLNKNFLKKYENKGSFLMLVGGYLVLGEQTYTQTDRQTLQSISKTQKND